MGLALPEDVIKIIEKSNYAVLFRLVFGPAAFNDVDIAYNNVGHAIAAFERSILLNKFTSKFDRFWKEQGKDVSRFGVKNQNFKYSGVPKNFHSRYFTRQEAEGLALFNASNKGNCAACHLTSNHVVNNEVYAPLFTDFTYDNLGIPVNPRIEALAKKPQPVDYGLGARIVELNAVTLGGVTTTFGADGVEVVASEIGKFKVPTLRNINRTAPYGHNGYFATLESITHFYNTRDTNPAAWPAPEVADTVNKIELGDLQLTPDQEAAIVAFMRTLTD
jgi:cytochrome c peroxidase